MHSKITNIFRVFQSPHQVRFELGFLKHSKKMGNFKLNNFSKTKNSNFSKSNYNNETIPHSESSQKRV